MIAILLSADTEELSIEKRVEAINTVLQVSFSGLASKIDDAIKIITDSIEMEDYLKASIAFFLLIERIFLYLDCST